MDDLYHVRRVIELYNGFLKAKSTLSGETVYTVGIPLQKKPHQPEALRSVVIPPVSFKENKPILGTLLLVEPYQAFRDLFVEMMSNQHRVLSAKDEVSALKLIGDQAPDVIIVADDLTKIRGSEFCQRIKNKSNTAHIPLILLTYRNDPCLQKQTLLCAADHTLCHPFEIMDLKAKIESVLYTLFYQRKFLQKSILLAPSEVNNDSHALLFFEKLSNYLRDHISDPELNVNKASKDLRISRVHFYRKVKALTGKSPVEFIRDFKLTVAVQLIEQHTYNINEICYRSGFQDVSYFRKCFKKKFGVCSSLYRKKETVIN